jgi:hypothetical protein
LLSPQVRKGLFRARGDGGAYDQATLFEVLSVPGARGWRVAQSLEDPAQAVCSGRAGMAVQFVSPRAYGRVCSGRAGMAVKGLRQRPRRGGLFRARGDGGRPNTYASTLPSASPRDGARSSHPKA